MPWGLPRSRLLECRRGRNTRHLLAGLFRQSVFGRLAGYEDVNDAERLARDPAMRAIVGREGLDRAAASSSQMGRFETEWLATDANLEALTDLSGAWIDRVQSAGRPHDRPRHGQFREPDPRRAGGLGLERSLRLHLLPPQLAGDRRGGRRVVPGDHHRAHVRPASRWPPPLSPPAAAGPSCRRCRGAAGRGQGAGSDGPWCFLPIVVAHHAPVAQATHRPVLARRSASVSPEAPGFHLILGSGWIGFPRVLRSTLPHPFRWAVSTPQPLRWCSPSLAEGGRCSTLSRPGRPRSAEDRARIAGRRSAAGALDRAPRRLTRGPADDRARHPPPNPPAAHPRATPPSRSPWPAAGWPRPPRR